MDYGEVNEWMQWIEADLGLISKLIDGSVCVVLFVTLLGE